MPQLWVRLFSVCHETGGPKEGLCWHPVACQKTGQLSWISHMISWWYVFTDNCVRCLSDLSQIPEAASPSRGWIVCLWLKASLIRGLSFRDNLRSKTSAFARHTLSKVKHSQLSITQCARCSPEKLASDAAANSHVYILKNVIFIFETAYCCYSLVCSACTESCDSTA